jgi:hypothetical protein
MLRTAVCFLLAAPAMLRTCVRHADIPVLRAVGRARANGWGRGPHGTGTRWPFGWRGFPSGCARPTVDVGGACDRHHSTGRHCRCAYWVDGPRPAAQGGVRGPVDTPESGSRAHCEREAVHAAAAKAFTEDFLAGATPGEVELCAWDKYGGRILRIPSPSRRRHERGRRSPRRPTSQRGPDRRGPRRPVHRARREARLVRCSRPTGGPQPRRQRPSTQW